MNSPASTIDSPIASATRTISLNNSEEECEQMVVSSRVAVKLGVVTFFGTIRSCQLGVRNTMLWHIQYGDGVDEEEVLLSKLKQRQTLYVEEQLDDTAGSTKQTATGPPNPPLSTAKKSNTKRKRLDMATETATEKENPGSEEEREEKEKRQDRIPTTQAKERK